MIWLALALGVWWLGLSWFELRCIMKLPELPPLPQSPPPAAMASATVVMPVRDDAQHVERSVRHLLAQQHVGLRLVVVDDRSTDGTDAVLARLAATDHRLSVLTVRELPPDWLGKTHALFVGAANVETPWLLFVDGDAELAPDTLAKAIAAAEDSASDHVALMPAIRPTTLLGRACLLAFQLVVQGRLHAVNMTPQRSFVGTGAFNLVRTEAYRRVGGHRALSLEVVDDVWLGCLLFRAGYRSRILMAPGDLTVDWGGTPIQLMRNVEKNMFAVLRYRTVVALGLVALATGLLTLTLLAPIVFGPPGWLTLAGYAATSLPGIALAHRMRWSTLSGLMTPLARCWLPLALMRSTLVTLHRGGVQWRGTFYPLAQLRRGQVV